MILSFPQTTRDPRRLLAPGPLRTGRQPRGRSGVRSATATPSPGPESRRGPGFRLGLVLLKVIRMGRGAGPPCTSPQTAEASSAAGARAEGGSAASGRPPSSCPTPPGRGRAAPPQQWREGPGGPQPASQALQPPPGRRRGRPEPGARADKGWPGPGAAAAAVSQPPPRQKPGRGARRLHLNAAPAAAAPARPAPTRAPAHLVWFRGRDWAGRWRSGGGRAPRRRDGGGLRGGGAAARSLAPHLPGSLGAGSREPRSLSRRSPPSRARLPAPRLPPPPPPPASSPRRGRPPPRLSRAAPPAAPPGPVGAGAGGTRGGAGVPGGGEKRGAGRAPEGERAWGRGGGDSGREPGKGDKKGGTELGPGQGPGERILAGVGGVCASRQRAGEEAGSWESGGRALRRGGAGIVGPGAGAASPPPTGTAAPPNTPRARISLKHAHDIGTERKLK